MICSPAIGGGVSRGAAGMARDRYRRAGQATHWFAQAEAITDASEMWRLAELGIAAADRGALLRPSPRSHPRLRSIGGVVLQRIGKPADKASSDAATTLFGQRRPTSQIDDVMR